MVANWPDAFAPRRARHDSAFQDLLRRTVSRARPKSEVTKKARPRPTEPKAKSRVEQVALHSDRALFGSQDLHEGQSDDQDRSAQYSDFSIEFSLDILPVSISLSLIVRHLGPPRCLPVPPPATHHTSFTTPSSHPSDCNAIVVYLSPTLTDRIGPSAAATFSLSEAVSVSDDDPASLRTAEDLDAPCFQQAIRRPLVAPPSEAARQNLRLPVLISSSPPSLPFLSKPLPLRQPSETTASKCLLSI